MDQQDSRTGFFGKLASQGDFVSRRLSPAFVRGWDDWLQEGLQHTRKCLGTQWQSVYLRSPIWHFALAAGVCTEPCWAGVLMPSVDRVGRYFPLTVTYGGQDVPVIERLRRDGGWYARIEELALSSLEEGFALEGFDLALISLPPPTRHSRFSHRPEPAASAAGKVWLELQEQARMQDAIGQWSAQLASLAGDRSLAGHSLFWTEGSSHLPPTLLLCQGLPTSQMFVEMLAGRTWERSTLSGC